MRKLFSTALVCILTAITFSCSDGAFSGDCLKEKTDTLSYIYGMNLSHQIDKGIVPQLKADYDVIMKTIEDAIDGKEEFKVGDVTINKDNMQELGMKYLGPELRGKIQAAMADSTGKTEVFDNPTDKKIASTILGADIAFNLDKAPFELRTKPFLQAIKDTHKGKQAISDEEAEEFINNYFTVEIPAQNAKLSKEWLAEIEKAEGVQKTESGLLYKIVNEGDINTKAVNDTDTVKVLYTGKTRDDKVFDSNRWNDLPEERKEIIKIYQPSLVEQNNPIEFPLCNVIKGWTEGMKLVGKGGRIMLWIPSELAYGERGSGQNIAPNEALYFDVELLDVTPTAE